MAGVAAVAGVADGRRQGWTRRTDGEWTTTGAGPAGLGAELPGVAAGGGHADAHEQPGPGGGRAAGRPGGLRRDGAGGAVVGRLRRHGPHAPGSGVRRDDAGAVRQARRRVPDARVGAAGAHRQLQPGARVGDLGRVPAPGADGPHDVRPDDGRVVDLHRHAGDPAGDLRVLRRDRPAALRRVLGRDHHPHRGPRRHGRSAAAGRHHERRGGAVHRRRWPPHRAAARDPLPGRGGRRPGRRHRPLRPGQGRAAGGQHRPAGQRGRRRAPRCWSGASTPTS